MGNVLGHLKPELVWKYFEGICSIPHPSKKEEKIREWLVSVGKNLGLETIVDSTGNVIIRKPATKGKENLKPVVLQGHMDMVAESNRGVEHDFDKDPIQPWIDGEWVKAKGTTLGADNGIGVAMALAALEDKFEHGPIEVLVTYDEETGLTGASMLDKDLLKGEILLNLDSEEEGTFFIGCAGGRNTAAEFVFKTEKVNGTFYELKVNGLLGGHSGLEIHQGRGNAIKIINRVLHDAAEKCELRIASIEGGNKHNAIPREAFAFVVVPDNKADEFEKLVKHFNEIIRVEFASLDAGVQVSAEKVKETLEAMDAETTKTLINLIYAIPHGVVKMSPDIKGLVETSTNLATIKTEKGKVSMVTSQRSSNATEIDDIQNMTAAVMQLAGCKVESGDGYPGWNPNMNSAILKVVQEGYKKLYGKEPFVTAIHAGLECGLISEKYPNMDMVSFGPTMFGVHSPDEKLKIDTVELVYNQLKDILQNIPVK